TLTPFLPGSDPVAALAGELAGCGRGVGVGWALAEVRERLGRGGVAPLAMELLVLASRGAYPRHHLLVVVDQLEELLTQTTPTNRAAFAELLSSGLGDAVRVVATLRPDWLPPLLANRELAGVLVRPFPLRPLSRPALRSVIEGPA